MSWIWREQGEVNERVWSQEREGGYDVTVL